MFNLILIVKYFFSKNKFVRLPINKEKKTQNKYDKL